MEWLLSLWAESKPFFQLVALAAYSACLSPSEEQRATPHPRPLELVYISKCSPSGSFPASLEKALKSSKAEGGSGDFGGSLLEDFGEAVERPPPPGPWAPPANAVTAERLCCPAEGLPHPAFCWVCLQSSSSLYMKYQCPPHFGVQKLRLTN